MTVITTTDATGIRRVVEGVETAGLDLVRLAGADRVEIWAGNQLVLSMSTAAALSTHAALGRLLTIPHHFDGD